jgi:hypothetical protein
MAVANTKSNIITNLDATPSVKNTLRIMGGVLREQVATVELAAADCDNSVYRMFRVHSSWRLSELTNFTDTLTSAVDADIGFYNTAENGGAVVNINAIADAVNIATASLTGVQTLWEGGSDNGVEDIELPVWEMIGGLTADPGIFYDLCVTLVSIGGAAGTLSQRLRYIANT